MLQPRKSNNSKPPAKQQPRASRVAAARTTLLKAQGFCWAIESAISNAKGTFVGEENLSVLKAIADQARHDVGDKVIASLQAEMKQ